MVNGQQWLTFNFTHYAMLLKVLLVLKANSTSPVCHPSSGHKHVIHTLKTIVKHDSLFKL